jgi:hypothetical protein
MVIMGILPVFYETIHADTINWLQSLGL